MDDENNLAMRCWLMWQGKNWRTKEVILQTVETSPSPASLRCQQGQRAKSRGRVTGESLSARRRKTSFLRCFSSWARGKSRRAMLQNLPSFRLPFLHHSQAFSCCFCHLLLEMVKDFYGDSEWNRVCFLVNCEPLYEILWENSQHPFHSQCTWGKVIAAPVLFECMKVVWRWMYESC